MSLSLKNSSQCRPVLVGAQTKGNVSLTSEALD